MISINTLKNYVQFITAKDASGNFIPPDDWNVTVPILVNKIVRKYIGLPEQYQPGNPQPAITMDITDVASEYIEPLRVEVPLSVPANGRVPRPADFLKKSSALVSSMTKEQLDSYGLDYECCNSGTMTPGTKGKLARYIQSWRPVTFITDQERSTWENSSYRKPSLEFPVACFLGNEIEFRPFTINSVWLVYLRYPKKPVWNYTITSGVPIYDPTGSQDIELPEMCIDELAVTIIERMGMVIREPGLIDWARYVKNSGK